LGGIYDLAGDPQAAATHYQKALDIAQNLRDPAAEAACSTNFGNVAHAVHKLDEALVWHRKALRIASRIEDRVLQVASRLNLGNAYLDAGRFRRAAVHYRKALPLAVEIGDKIQQTNALIGLGNASAHAARAVRFYRQALTLAAQTGHPNALSTIYANLGYASAVAQPKDALLHLRRSVEIAESVGIRVPNEPLKIAFYGTRSAVYPFLVQLSLELGRSGEAFAFVERSKAKAFLDNLAEKLPPDARSIPERGPLKTLRAPSLLDIRTLLRSRGTPKNRSRGLSRLLE
jgi:tetratricopeptide (TPR) repeat protein